MPPGFCVDCRREIRKGVRCHRCAIHGGGTWTRGSGIGQVVVRRLSQTGTISTVFTARDRPGVSALAQVWAWLVPGKRRRHGARRWIEAGDASAVHARPRPRSR